MTSPATITTSPTISPTISPTSTATRSIRREVAEGARMMAPWLVGVAPFGMVVGTTIRTGDVPLAAGLATGATIYSGSAQLTAVELLGDGATVAVVVLSVLVINARLLLYSSSIAPHWRGTSVGYRAMAGYLLVDPSYAVGMERYRSERPGGHVTYLAAGIVLWVGWHAAMLAGILIGGGVPDWLELQYAVPLFLLAEVVRVARTRSAIVASAVGASGAVVGTRLPLHTGLLVGVVAAVGVASLFDRGEP